MVHIFFMFSYTEIQLTSTYNNRKFLPVNESEIIILQCEATTFFVGPCTMPHQ